MRQIHYRRKRFAKPFHSLLPPGLFTASKDKSINLLELNSQNSMWKQAQAHDHPISSMLVNGTQLFTGDDEGVVKVLIISHSSQPERCGTYEQRKPCEPFPKMRTLSEIWPYTRVNYFAQGAPFVGFLTGQRRWNTFHL